MLKSINPYTQETILTFEEETTSNVEKKIKKAHKAYLDWRFINFERRKSLILEWAEVLEKNKNLYAKAMTLEMGKPISQAIAEIDKCIWLCSFYAEQAAGFLAPQEIETEAYSSFIRYEPLGVILGVMPWNYPFWQVFRLAVPAILAGNTVLLKHASNVMQSAENIANSFTEAGFPEGVFQNLIIKSDKVEAIIRNPNVKAVSLTGSKPAGSAVASVAAQEIKKSVLELGGSNALVVFEDAEIDKAIDICIQARFQNTGQSCIAGKRLLLHERIYDIFLEKLLTKVYELKVGDPLDEETYISVMAKEELAEELENQLKKGVEEGAKVILGGKRKAAFFEPSIVINVTPENTLFNEETFGPLLAVTSFKTDMEAIDLVNSSEYGLGVSIFTQDAERAKAMIPQFDDGAVFINAMVKSDPRLPFGGTKSSGYGRELSAQGIREFVNIKTVYVNQYE